MSDDRHTLAGQLGRTPPAGVAELGEREQRVLAEALRDARRGQAAALAKAGEESLRYVPTPLRRAVRKVVGL